MPSTDSRVVSAAVLPLAGSTTVVGAGRTVSPPEKRMRGSVSVFNDNEDVDRLVEALA